jgi:hypothetical protein
MRPAYESTRDKNNRGGTEYQTAITTCERQHKDHTVIPEFRGIYRAFKK